MVLTGVDVLVRAATKGGNGESEHEVGSGGAGECAHLARKSLTSLALTPPGVPPSSADSWTVMRRRRGADTRWRMRPATHVCTSSNSSDCVVSGVRVPHRQRETVPTSRCPGGEGQLLRCAQRRDRRLRLGCRRTRGVSRGALVVRHAHACRQRCGHEGAQRRRRRTVGGGLSDRDLARSVRSCRGGSGVAACSAARCVATQAPRPHVRYGG
jgi:hypothetical protein